MTWIEWNEAESARGIAADVGALARTEENEHWRNRSQVAAFLKMNRMGPLTKYKVTIKVEEEKE